MRVAWCVLLCFAAASGDQQGSGSGAMTNRHRRSAGVFLSITGRKASKELGELPVEKPSDKNNIKTSVLPVQLPIQLGGQGGVTLPVLVLPVPVYTQGPDTCELHHNQDATATEPAAPENSVPHRPGYQVDRRPPTPVTPAPYIASRQHFSTTSENAAVTPDPEPLDPKQINQQLADPPNHFQQQGPLRSVLPSIAAAIPTPQIPDSPLVQNVHEAIKTLSSHSQPPEDQNKSNHVISSKVIPSRSNFNGGLKASHRVHFKVEAPGAPAPSLGHQDEQVFSSSPPAEEPIPYSKGLPYQLFKTSSEVVQSFLRQSPVAPELPAVVPGRELPARVPAAAPASQLDAAPIPAPAPPVPRFTSSLRLRADLTVPRADYTEAFETEWHAESQTGRTVVEDGGTTFYRAPLPDGRVQFLEVRVDRSGDKEVRRCTLSPLMPAADEDQAFPGLPDMDRFNFAGYTSAEGRPLVERWQRVVEGGPGEGGAAAGEALTFHHEMLVTRDNGEPEPLRYSVVTDSSILGPASDRYSQRYRAQKGPSAFILPDTSKECDELDGLPEPQEGHHHSFAEVVARFNPLREFALPTRDTRYDAALDKFKSEFQRKYVDAAEEAVRKNLLTQASRFVAAGNRLASSFELGVNFLADRLDDELEQLFGVAEPKDGADELGLIPFPYSENEVKELTKELPDEFDWRPRGAVSPVRFQGTTCASCWAFAVAGATEGALFKKTNRLVPLSPQCLVDCGRPFGTNGCNGTWPSFAYDYVKARGLPSWDEYTNYQAKVLECKDRSVPPVTHIGGHVNVTANSVSALKVAIKKHAPNVVIVDAKAKSFIHYKKGVLKDKRCGQNKPALNHAVLAVGWGRKEGEHFILKNSWTDKWGEQGYVRVAPDSCALLQRPSYPQLTEPNIDREELRTAAASVKED